MGFVLIGGGAAAGLVLGGTSVLFAGVTGGLGSTSFVLVYALGEGGGTFLGVARVARFGKSGGCREAWADLPLRGGSCGLPWDEGGRGGSSGDSGIFFPLCCGGCRLGTFE